MPGGGAGPPRQPARRRRRPSPPAPARARRAPRPGRPSAAAGGGAGPASAPGASWAPGAPGPPPPRAGGEGPAGGPSWPRGTARPPSRPAYLQGAGVTIDQQTEDRDLDAAGACGQRPGEVLPGARGERGARDALRGVRPRTQTIHLPRFLTKRLFLEKCGLLAANQGQRPHCPVWPLCGRLNIKSCECGASGLPRAR